MAAYSAQVRSVAAAQHLHAIITAVSHYNIALTIQRNTAVAVDLPWTAAFAAHAAHVSAVAQSNNLQAMIVFVGNNNVALVVPCHKIRAIELSVG